MPQLNKESGCYKIDDQYFLCLKEEDGGFGYECSQINTNELIAKGLVLWEDIEKLPVHGAITAARILAISEIGLEGRKVSLISEGV